MTAKTSQHLADTLRAAGFEELALLAEADAFHDFLSTSPIPAIDLDRVLYAIQTRGREDRFRIAAAAIRQRHHKGEFDASLEESWAASDDGQAAFDELTKGK